VRCGTNSLLMLSTSLACQGGCDERKRPTVDLSVEASGGGGGRTKETNMNQAAQNKPGTR
jgi:hypothetical protein